MRNDLYKNKTKKYYRGARTDFIDRLPQNPQGNLFEIGGGNGDTSQYAVDTGKCASCYGVELCSEATQEAIARGHEVRVGDIEAMDLDYPNCFFDVLIMSEVLEHLRDPGGVLKKMRKFMKPDSIVMAGSPNVCHYSVIISLLSGRWKLEKSGIFDETHLRWFGPENYRELFETSGYSVEVLEPAFPLGRKAKLLNGLTFRRFEYLFHKQIYLMARPLL